jgi:hypothetical protein
MQKKVHNNIMKRRRFILRLQQLEKHSKAKMKVGLEHKKTISSAYIYIVSRLL